MDEKTFASDPLWARDVAVTIRDSEILRGVTISFPEKRVTGILGPNGAGKTTLLRVLAGTLPPTRGDVHLDGRPLSSYGRRELAQRLGVIPQYTEFTLELTVREIVSMGRFAHRPIYASPEPRDRIAIEDAIRTMELESFADRPSHTLSGGERQRMWLAQLLAQDPHVVLLDEPTAHLDIKYQGEMLRLVRRLVAERGWTVGVVLHDLNLAYRFCDRLVFLRDGRVLGAGDVEEMANAELIRDTFDAEADFSTYRGSPYVQIAY